ncbi:RNA-directed DNA polymerase, eukaryota [Tanacetum coccineum]
MLWTVSSFEEVQRRNPKSGKPEHVKKDGGNNRNGAFTPRMGVGSMENGKSFVDVLSSKNRSEGFDDLTIRYIGELWIILEFESVKSKDLFRDNTGAVSWFSVLRQASNNFMPEGRIVWVEVEEVPGWILEFLDDSDDESQSEVGINDHEHLGHDKHSCGEDNDVNEVVETLFDESSGEKKNHSEDPFGFYSLLNKNKDDTYVNGTEDDQSIKYPPGFTPVAENREFNLSKENVRSTNVENLQQGDDVEILDEQKDIHDVKGYNTQDSVSACSGKFKRSAAPETGGSILCLLEELVKGNLCFDHVHSDSVGKSGGILYVWDPNSFCKNNVTVFDYFVIIRGVWLKTNVNLLIVVVYAPQDSRDKRMLWDYLTHVSSQWDGEVVMMGDFNEVRFKSDRFGSVFNVRGADVFNSFIANAGLVEVPLGGSAFTWSHKSATKMSKIDRFLISDGLMNTCPNINAITLERYLSDHRPILFRESTYDYGPIPFRFYHHWLALDGFDNFVIDIWRNTPGDKSNAMRNLMYKLKFLKVRIRGWLSTNRNSTKAEITRLIGELAKLDEVIDNGNATDDTVPRRLEVLNSIQNLNQIQATEAAQKAKIKWSVEGDENVRFFHGMINKKRSQQNIRGVMIDGKWIEEPSRVKKQFFQHFRDRFDEPKDDRVRIDMCFPRSLSNEQKDDLERMVSMEEVKRAVWDCGTDKSPGPDGFSFGFYRHFWPTIDNEVFEAVKYFFIHNNFPIGCNSAFIALIPKILDANMVKDFRPISLIGSIYKIVAKILANRIVGVLDDIVNEVQSAFIAERQILDGPFILNEVMHWCKTKKKQALFFKVDFEKAYDTVRWDFLDDVLHKFGFGNKWRLWIQSCLRSSRGSIIVNGSPTEEFQFFKGLKQGDPLSPFLFILIMESLHLSFQRVVDAGEIGDLMWLKTNVNLLIVVVYAPQDSRDKRMLWDYLTHVSSQWDGEVVMMGDFNEVRFKSDRFGSVFNVRGADVFNSFIANAGLVEVPLGGSAFTWSHKSATKMSKIDRFLISDGLMNTCPNINAITLERYLSDHRPILFRESTYDYGPIPFRFYHHWLALDGFDNFVIDIWRNTPGDKSNAMRNLMYKLKFLKVRIRGWLSTNRNSTKAEITRLIGELAKLDEVIDNGNATDDTVPRRLEVLNSIQNVGNYNLS